MKSPWESHLTVVSAQDCEYETLGPASEYEAGDSRRSQWEFLDYESLLKADTAPLPRTIDREGYFGNDHFSYWASGLQDANLCLEACEERNIDVRTILDFGCATGRVLRHFSQLSSDVQVYGCDINRRHVDWCNRHLSQVTVFQNHALPSLPLPDNSMDLITAFSVFTHIETLESGWLMELNRVLKPGGLAWITVHSEHTLAEMHEGWPLWKNVMNHPDIDSLIDRQSRSFPGDRLVVRWKSDQPSSGTVFYKHDYLLRVWSRFMTISEFRRREPRFQDVLILRKKPFGPR